MTLILHTGVGFEKIYLIPYGIIGDLPLEDESLPLHLSTVSDKTTIRIIGGRVHIQFASQFGHLWQKSFPRNSAVNQMKKRILLVDRCFVPQDKDVVEDVWLFVQRGDSYRKLDDETPIGSLLSDNDIIYLVEDRFYYDSDVFPVYYKGEEIGRVGWTITYFDPNYYSDTALSLKLRIQELLGFPVSRVDVKFRGGSMKNDQRINNRYVNKTADIRIEVA